MSVKIKREGKLPSRFFYSFFIFGFDTNDAIYPKNTAAAIPPGSCFNSSSENTYKTRGLDFGYCSFSKQVSKPS